MKRADTDDDNGESENMEKLSAYTLRKQGVNSHERQKDRSARTAREKRMAKRNMLNNERAKITMRIRRNILNIKGLCGKCIGGGNNKREITSGMVEEWGKRKMKRMTSWRKRKEE